MTALFLVLYAVLALVVVEAYSIVLLAVCSAILAWRSFLRSEYKHVHGGRWVDYVLIFLIARSVLILVYGWILGH